MLKIEKIGGVIVIFHSITDPSIFVGTTCEEEVSGCEPNPCQHGGSCFTDSLGVFCACIPPYQGLLCQLTASKSARLMLPEYPRNYVHDSCLLCFVMVR